MYHKCIIMNRLLLILQAFILISCSSTTGDKIKKAVVNIELDGFEAKGEKVASISADSVQFELGSMAALYLNESARQLEAPENLHTAADPAVANFGMYRLRNIEDNYERLKLMAETADTSRNIYFVNYRLSAKTDQGTYQRSAYKYLSAAGLKEITLDSSILKY
jgi:hypothetical protein